MSFKAPNLDDRTFQKIVDEAKKRIAEYCPEWTDHNDSDPGMTLIQLFAWMMDSLFYRMNLIPELHYFKFLEFLGIERQVPKPAHAQVTFWLTEHQKDFDPIQAGTEVATTQTETEEAFIFTTEDEFIIHTPQLRLLVTQDSNHQPREMFDLAKPSDRLRLGNGVNIFASTPPRKDDALYLGFTNDLSYHVLQLDLTVFETRAAGGSREDPPYEWYACNNNGWEPCEGAQKLETSKTLPKTEQSSDSTENLNINGSIQLHMPQMHPYLLAGEKLYWLRVQLNEARYKEHSPRLKTIEVKVIGCTISAIHARPSQIGEEHVQPSQKGEELGVSNGLAGQRFVLHYKPILERRAGEHVCVFKNGGPPKGEDWEEVPDFADSTAQDKHYTLNSQTGELRFGPAIRQPDGTFKQYGDIPPANAGLRFTCYHYLEPERIGNVRRGKINTRKSSISYIKTVENREDARDGREAESLDELRLRVARMLRTSQRAVTAADFEQLATEDFNREQAERLVARAKCLTASEKKQRLAPVLLAMLKEKGGMSPALVELLRQKDDVVLELAQLLQEKGNFAPELMELLRTQGSFAPNLVELIVVPYVKSNDQGAISVDELRQAFRVVRIKLEPFLNQHSLLTTQLELHSPTYQPVVVHVSLHPDRKQGAALEQTVFTAVFKKLHTFINPVNGGPDGGGWPFGRSLHISDLYECLQTGENALKASQIRQIRLFAAEESGVPTGHALAEIMLAPLTVLVSGQHIVRFEGA